MNILELVDIDLYMNNILYIVAMYMNGSYVYAWKYLWKEDGMKLYDINKDCMG